MFIKSCLRYKLGLLLTLIISLFIVDVGYSQNAPKHTLTEENRAIIREFETSLKVIGDSMLDGISPRVRVNALKVFIPTLKKALKIEGSFEYGFDSLKFLRILTPDDKQFRIFNWVMRFDDGTYKYFGAIQMNTKDSLKLIPMYDLSAKMDSSMEETPLDANNWFGALYSDIIPCKIKRKKYYVLLGWNGDNIVSDKRIIEVLYFNKKNKPLFGAPIFDHKGDIKHRVVFVHSGKANMLLNYLPEHKVISFDHLSAQNKATDGKPWTYIPDGSYNFFKLKKNKWVFSEEDLFDVIKKPIKEADGK